MATIPTDGSRSGRQPAGRAVEELGERLGHTFRDLDLLALSVTHRSFCAENAGYVSNERLEFLGDAVLSIVVTDHLFATYPLMPEGELAKVRASVVSAVTLAEVAGELQVGAAMRLGKGEDASGGRLKSSILADAMEAVFGAVYLDGGIDAVRPIIIGLLEERIAAAATGPGGHDYKTQLQELAARRLEQLPVYELRDEGPDHEKRFYATVLLDGTPKGSGEGRSKKQAEQAAARAALRALVARADLDGDITDLAFLTDVAHIRDVDPVEPDQDGQDGQDGQDVEDGQDIEDIEDIEDMQAGNRAGPEASTADATTNEESEGLDA